MSESTFHHFQIACQVNPTFWIGWCICGYSNPGLSVKEVMALVSLHVDTSPNLSMVKDNKKTKSWVRPQSPAEILSGKHPAHWLVEEMDGGNVAFINPTYIAQDTEVRMTIENFWSMHNNCAVT